MGEKQPKLTKKQKDNLKQRAYPFKPEDVFKWDGHGMFEEVCDQCMGEGILGAISIKELDEELDDSRSDG